MGRTLIVLVALLTMAGAANATTLAGGAIYGGPTQTTAVCYLFNAGNSTVSVSGSEIVRQNTGPVPLAQNNCGTLAAGGICAILANVGNVGSDACKFVISPDGAAVRGTLEIRNSGSTVLQNEELR
jgi:hypothetical protein